MPAPTSTALRLLLVASLGFLAACGTEGGDRASDAPATSEAPSAPDAPPEDAEDDPAPDDPDAEDAPDAAPDLDDPATRQIVDTYLALGFTEDEATCLAEGLLGGFQDGTVDQAQVMDVINGCDIPIDRLNEIGMGAGGGSMEDGMRAGIEASMRTAGLDDADAECVAEQYVERYGTDIAPSQRPSTFFELLEACDLDPSAFSPGG